MRLGWLAGLAVVAAAVSGAGTASAAPSGAGATWTGCYGGANVGLASSLFHFSKPGDFDEGGHTATGWVGGGQLGCDYQISGAWVIGIQGMLDAADMNGQSYSTEFPTHLFTTHIDSFGTLTGRFGYAASPSLLLFAKAGIGWTRDHSELYTGDTLTETLDSTRRGADLGIGVAWMPAAHWDVTLEYDHMFLGTEQVDFLGVSGPSDDFTEEVGRNFDKVLLSLNYHFLAH